MDQQGHSDPLDLDSLLLVLKIYKDWTLKTPRKSASENVVCLCRLLNILANFSNLFLRTGKQCGLRSDCSEQSDLGPHCLQKWLLKSQADDKADDNCCDWQFKSEVLYFSYWNCTGFLFFSSEPEEWLTFTILWANSANNKSIFFLFFFPPKKMKCQILFSGKNKKNHFNMSSAEYFTQSAKH